MSIALYPLHCLSWPSKVDAYPIMLGDGVSITNEQISLTVKQKFGMSIEDQQHIQNIPILSIDENYWTAQQMSLLMMIGCRLISKCSVFIRYRINKNESVAKIFDNYISYGNKEAISIDELKEAWILALKLKELSDASFRAQNAVYFLKEAYLSSSGINAILLFITSLETLTSGSEREGKVEMHFKQRINKFSGLDVGELYGIRSAIVHGRYSVTDEIKNIHNAKLAEDLASSVFKMILKNQEHIEAFKNETKRLALWNRQ